MDEWNKSDRMAADQPGTSTRPPQIREMGSKIAAHLEELDQMIEELDKRLSEISRPGPGPVIFPPNKSEESLVLLAEYLQSRDWQIQQAIYKIQNIIARLEI
jgi:hypothetical protein